MSEAGVATRRWRGIDELGRLVGAYCWVESRIFELCGAWATATIDTPWGGLDAAQRVWCAATSRRHGLRAASWAERLPVRAGIDRGALTTPPSGPLPGELDALAAVADARVALAVLVEAVLPCLRAVYDAHLRTASPVSEASVLEVLAGARRDLAGEIREGGALLEGPAQGLERDVPLTRRTERAFEETDVFPAVHTS